MTPYYSDDLVTIYHGDCREWTGVADAVIADPPYGFGAYPTDQAIAGVIGLCRRYATGTTAVFGYPELLVQWCVDEGAVPDEWVTWWPPNAMRGRDGGLQRESEHIAIFGRLSTMPTRPKIDNSLRIARRMGRRQDTKLGDVWRDLRPGAGFNSGDRLHPNEKPLSLMRQLVTICAEPDGVVLDPFAGSGTTLVAAKSLGRRAIGIEIDEAYCEIAATRCSQEVLGLTA